MKSEGRSGSTKKRLKHDVCFKDAKTLDQLRTVAKKKGLSVSELIARFCVSAMDSLRWDGDCPVFAEADLDTGVDEVSVTKKSDGSLSVDVKNLKDGQKLKVAAGFFTRRDGRVQKMYRWTEFVRAGNTLEHKMKGKKCQSQ